MRICLRPIEKEDAELIVKWRNDPKVAAHCFNKQPITVEAHNAFYKANIETGKYLQFIVEKIEEDFGVVSYPIATVYLKDMDINNRKCELCIFTSSDSEWNTDSQSIAIKMLLEKAFDELKMHKVYSYVFYKFLDEAELLKSAGFSTEAILKDEAIDENGKFTDIVRFSIIK